MPGAKRFSPARLCSPQEVLDAYRVLLCRNPESPQIFDQYVNRRAVVDFVSGILASAEFSAVGEAHANVVADAAGIAMVYKLLLHREPDANALTPSSAEGPGDLRAVTLRVIASREFSSLRVEKI